MDFNLSGLHLGDLVLAAPAMRPGDRVAIEAGRWIDGIPASRVDRVESPPVGGMLSGHHTDAWLRRTGRAPLRWRPLKHHGGGGVLLAPDVVSAARRWHRWPELARALPTVPFDVSGAATRAEWLRAIARADVVVCPDTATAHVADAIGVPVVVALYGSPAAFCTHAPFWNRSRCVVRDGMAAITVDDVLEMIGNG